MPITPNDEEIKNCQDKASRAAMNYISYIVAKKYVNPFDYVAMEQLYNFTYYNCVKESELTTETAQKN